MEKEAEYCVNFKSDTNIEGIVALYDADDECHIEVVLSGKKYSATSNDYFEAFSIIRKELEMIGVIPQCYAAAKNVFPSPMSRGMGGGIKAYQLSIGKQALMKDLVNIFETSDNFEFVSVEEQESFYDQWLASLGH
ncbi:MAG: hypothetical protein SynsKO_44880 [Synoicihabitans sp.]